MLTYTLSLLLIASSLFFTAVKYLNHVKKGKKKRGVKLYGMNMSTCSSRVMICLAEKKIEFEFIDVNLFKMDHKKPYFLSKNPFGQIPALEDGDLTIFESRAISTYVADKYKNKSINLLRQGDLKEATLVKVWLEVESQRFEPVIRPIIRELFVGPLFGKTPDQTIIDDSVEKLGKLLDVYEERLGCTKYLAGDYYTLADIHHIPCTYHLMKTPYASLIHSRPCVKAWWDDISLRPAVKKVTQKMVYAKY